ncbi:MAG: acylphosphatase [Nitrospirota bacterium]|nr:acylphosphatase [Nitrospirota bacterium]
MKDLARVHAIVNGKVQGVGFRAFTQDQATQKGIVGWVRNREDGSVELEAEGPRAILDDFLKVLEQGPGLSRVEHITVDWKAANRQTQGFTVLRS